MNKTIKTVCALASILSSAFFATGCFDLSGGGGGGGGGNNEVRSAFDGPGGFLWKPVSEGDGRLVVLFPTDISPTVVSGEVHNSFPPRSSTLLEAGNFAYRSANGGRAHFRFSKSGGGYGNNVYAVAIMPDGRRIGFLIPNGGARTD
jgi:hypothetical protein